MIRINDLYREKIESRKSQRRERRSNANHGNVIKKTCSCSLSTKIIVDLRGTKQLEYPCNQPPETLFVIVKEGEVWWKNCGIDFARGFNVLVKIRSVSISCAIAVESEVFIELPLLFSTLFYTQSWQEITFNQCIYIYIKSKVIKYSFANIETSLPNNLRKLRLDNRPWLVYSTCLNVTGLSSLPDKS